MDLGVVKVNTGIGPVDLGAKLEDGAVVLAAKIPIEQAIFLIVDQIESLIPGDQKVQAQMLKDLLKLKMAG